MFEQSPQTILFSLFLSLLIRINMRFLQVEKHFSFFVSNQWNENQKAVKAWTASHDYVMGFSKFRGRLAIKKIRKSSPKKWNERRKNRNEKRMKQILEAYPVKQTNKRKTSVLISCLRMRTERSEEHFSSMILITKEEWCITKNLKMLNKLIEVRCCESKIKGKSFQRILSSNVDTLLHLWSAVKCVFMSSKTTICICNE